LWRPTAVVEYWRIERGLDHYRTKEIVNIVLHGIVRGRTVEFDRDPGIEEIYGDRQRSAFRDIPAADLQAGKQL
jgi:hypothetical protein